MLKTRVIPVLLWADHGLVKGRNFDHSRRIGSVVSAINVYSSRDVDELILVDVRATKTGEPPRFDELKTMARACSFPLGIGGGIKTLSHVESTLRLGADKVVINSAAYADKKLIQDAAGEFGSQSIVVSVDYRSVDGQTICYSHCGVRCENLNLLDWVREVEQLGAGEIIVCNCDRDGEMGGYDLDAISAVSQVVSVPVIASGGAGRLSDFVDVVKVAGADAVAAGSVFSFTEITPNAVKEVLHAQGVPVRAWSR